MSLPRMTYKRCPGIGGSPCVQTIPQHVEACRYCRGAQRIIEAARRRP